MQNATWTRLASYGALSLLTVACSLFGCVSKNADAGDVIERSAELKPAWAEGDVSLAGTAEVFPRSLRISTTAFSAFGMSIENRNQLI